MAAAKIFEHGQITIPKQIRESLGLKKGDLQEWSKLLQVMNTVHTQNRGISEEEVYQDVQRAVVKLRQEDYERTHNEDQAS